MLHSPVFLFILAAVLLCSFVLSVALGPSVIEFLRRIKFGQNINEDAPASHQQKQGTPSSGGFLIALGVTAGLLVYLLISSVWPALGLSPFDTRLVAVYLVFIAHAGLGFLDDTLKAKRGKSLGLKAREKLVIQVVISLVFTLWLRFSFPGAVTSSIVFWSGLTINFGPAYFVFVFLLMIGLSNATNLTDGLDGLATGLSISTSVGILAALLFAVHGFFQLTQAQASLSAANSASGSGSEVFCTALIGACLGFLWFNAHPARVFMGDTGSLALGGSFAAIGVINKIELPLLLFTLVFLIEMMSVLIQVGVFKATGGKPNGRRVFKMAPIHHHFELLGWPETQVVARFCIVGVLAAVLGVVYVAALQI